MVNLLRKLTKAMSNFAMFDVEKYAAYALQQRANGYRYFAENHATISAVPVGGQVLDIGCGPGTVTQLLTYYTNLGKIIGTDIDPKMIEEAKRINLNSRMTFLVWDVQETLQPEFTEKFDLVTANAMMHWIPDQHAALKNIHKCLKPGGYFLAHFKAKPGALSEQANTPNEQKWLPYINDSRLTLRMEMKHGWMLAEKPAEFYRKMVEDNHPFEIIRCEHRSMDTYYNELELDAHCELWAGNMLKPGISDDKRQEFIKELQEATRKSWECTNTECGKFYKYKNERIVFVAKKPEI